LTTDANRRRRKLIKTLAMLKMEKNFIAHIEKKYPRKPYEHYPLSVLVDRAFEELDELLDAYDLLDYEQMRQECADVSNIIDYIFEAATRQEVKK